MEALFVLRDTGETVGLFPLIQHLCASGVACTALVGDAWSALPPCNFTCILEAAGVEVLWFP